MGTLLKYEFRRSRTIFLGIIGVTLLVELVYLVGFFTKVQALFTVGLIGGILCLALGAVAILLYGVIMFNDDISKKPGYLLFSTPRSAAQIVGAKLLMTLFALVGITILFSLLIALDVFLALQRNGTSLVALLSMFDASITENGFEGCSVQRLQFLRPFYVSAEHCDLVYLQCDRRICCDRSAENCHGQSEGTHDPGSDSLVCNYKRIQPAGRTDYHTAGIRTGRRK